MNFDPDPADEAFRAELREFLSAHVPAAQSAALMLKRPFVREEVRRWTRTLNGRGWLVPGWPEEWGGRNWSARRRYMLMEELCKTRCTELDSIALQLVGPVLFTFGTQEQKERYLPRILNADDFWCQGFSEPQAGSDLSLVRTRALNHGDHYIVNGHKVWTTNAHNANMIFTLVRVDTGGRAQRGLSILLIDMRTPGVSVRPIITIDGRHEINEVFFEDVRIPAESLIGTEGRGWAYARFLLANERALVANAPRTRRDLDALKAIAAGVRHRDRPLTDDPIFGAKLARLEIELIALEYTVLRELDLAPDDPVGERLGPVLKVRGAELRQKVSELALEALGDRGLAFYAPRLDPDCPDELAVLRDQACAEGVAAEFMFRQSATIAGGSNEIQRNVLAMSALS